jgi:hypothetical protein
VHQGDNNSRNNKKIRITTLKRTMTSRLVVGKCDRHMDEPIRCSVLMLTA